MKQMQNIVTQLQRSASITGTTLPGVPLLELSGDQRILIENHCGITCYSHREIRIKVKFGQICVSGCNLELMHMSATQLVITGNIAAINIIRGNESCNY